MAKRRPNKVTEAMRQAARRRAEAADRGFTPTSIKFPNDLKLFSVKSEGIYLFDIVPYTAGVGNPNAEKGSLYFERTYYVHRGIGVNGNSYICPAKVYGKKCPICAHITKLEREGADKQTIDALRPKNRQLFLVYDRKDEELKLLDSSYHLFGKLLDDRVLEPDAEEEGWAYYWFPNDEGKTLRVNFKQETFGGRAFFKASSIDFKARKEALPDEVLEHQYCLDDMLIQVDYEELKKKFYEEEDDEEEEEKPVTRTTKTKSKSAPVEDDEDEEDTADDSWDDDEEEEEKPKSKPKSKSKPAPVEDDEDDDWDDEEEEESDDEDEAPADDEDDDWDDEEESDEEESDDEDEEEDDWDDSDDEEESEEEEDDWDDDEEDEAPAKPARKPVKQAATKPSKPARATKPATKPSKPAGKPTKPARRPRK